MSRIVSLIVLLLFIRVCSAAPVLALNADFSQIQLGLHTDFICDSAANMTLEQARHSRAWQQSNVAVPNFGFTSDHYWFRVPLRAERDFSNLIVEVGYALLDSVDYYLERDGEIIAHHRVGNAVDFNQRPLKHPLPLFPLQLEKDKNYVLYFYVSSANSMQVPLSLWSERAF
ncbi:MAG TPA: 7TM-DISM domain-containing protein [Pseudomonadales bacterium]|nr:7TM-DISM domain-containing protein [Pseudomonadales bacterium]